MTFSCRQLKEAVCEMSCQQLNAKFLVVDNALWELVNETLTSKIPNLWFWGVRIFI